MTIFIKTWLNDLDWLSYCLRSIAKYAPDFKVVIVADENCRNKIETWNLTKEKVFYVNPTYDGYLYQQYIKLTAYEYVDTDFILFLDSDCIFTAPITKDIFIKDGKPDLLITPYELVGDAICWKAVTESVTGVKVDYEFMRRMPMVYHRSTLQEMWEKHSEVLSIRIRNAKNRAFSEFNILGAYIYFNEKNKYNLIDTSKEDIPYNPTIQKWSWGGLNAQIKQELEQYL